MLPDSFLIFEYILNKASILPLPRYDLYMRKMLIKFGSVNPV